MFAAGRGHYDLVMDMINRGATDYNIIAIEAVMKGRYHLAMDMIKLGADKMAITTLMKTD